VLETGTNAEVPGQLSQDLPTWTHFEQATQIVTEDYATQSVPCGPDIAGQLRQSVQEAVDAGYHHLYFHQIGPTRKGSSGTGSELRDARSRRGQLTRSPVAPRSATRVNTQPAGRI
jgi:hypothetical protein